MSRKLTGQTRYRIGLGNKLILQVEEHWEEFRYFAITQKSAWRDAKLEDLQVTDGQPKVMS